MTPAQHAAYIRQLEFKLYKAEHGMGMPHSPEDVAHYRRLIAEAVEAERERREGSCRGGEGVMSTHTPGPWTVVQDTGAEDDYYVITKKEDVLATGLTEADADLIAAAPDLLAALKEAMPYLEAYYGQGYQSAIVANVRAAIAKAEGQCCQFHDSGGPKTMSCGGDTYIPSPFAKAEGTS